MLSLGEQRSERASMRNSVRVRSLFNNANNIPLNRNRGGGAITTHMVISMAVGENNARVGLPSPLWEVYSSGVGGLRRRKKEEEEGKARASHWPPSLSLLPSLIPSLPITRQAGLCSPKFSGIVWLSQFPMLSRLLWSTRELPNSAGSLSRD